MSWDDPSYKELHFIIVKIMGFKLKSKEGSHEQYEGLYNGKRTIITLDKGHDNFPPRTKKNNLSSMAKQAGFLTTGTFKSFLRKHLK